MTYFPPAWNNCCPNNVASFLSSTAGTYTVVIERKSNVLGCKSDSASGKLTVNPKPVVKDATDAFCVDKQSNTFLSNYDSKVGPGTGYTVTWYSDIARTTIITETGDLAEGNHTYYATVTNSTTK